MDAHAGLADASTLAAPPPTPPSAPARWRADAALVVAAFCFGTTFVVVQDAVDQVDPMPFLAVRFLIGSTVLALIGRTRPASRHEVEHGVAAGSALLVGYAFQTVGLQYTSASTSALLTYMLVVFVPAIAFVVLRRRPHPLTLVGIGLAMVGLFLLTNDAGGRAGDGGSGGFGWGEVLTLGCAVAFAVHILILAETADRHDPVRFTCIQVTTVGAISLGCALGQAAFAGNARAATDFDGPALGAAVFTGIFATAAAFLAMTWAQRSVSPSRAALILLLEPVFAAAIGAATGEPIHAGVAMGGALILAAVVVAEVLPSVLTTWSR